MEQQTVFERIYAVVRRIPAGKVASYGQVAWLAGNPRWARVVGYALHRNPDPDTIPCHRGFIHVPVAQKLLHVPDQSMHRKAGTGFASVGADCCKILSYLDLTELEMGSHCRSGNGFRALLCQLPQILQIIGQPVYRLYGQSP